MSQTIADVSKALSECGKPASESTIRRYFRALDIRPAGARQLPQRYPDDTATKILNYLGLGSPVESTRPALGILPIAEIKRRAKSKHHQLKKGDRV